MADRRVPRDRLRQVDRALGRPAGESPLDTPVLVAERDLQVKDLFAMALEAEMPRFDDAGVDGAHGHFVDLLPLDAVVVGDADDRGFRGLPVPGVVAGAVRGMVADRLRPGVPFRTHAVLLGHLALEEVDL